MLFIAILIFAFLSSVFTQSATIVSEKANLRGTPTEQGKVVDTISRNAPVEIINQRGVWFLVQTIDYVGWIHGNTIKLNGSSGIETVDDAPLPSVTRTTRRRQATPTAPQGTQSRGYIRGPRGGCYYINSRGNKTYVDRGLCS
jgi:uncharacterized protein YgiM (DUF1202 family)